MRRQAFGSRMELSAAPAWAMRRPSAESAGTCKWRSWTMGKGGERTCVSPRPQPCLAIIQQGVEPSTTTRSVRGLSANDQLTFVGLF